MNSVLFSTDRLTIRKIQKSDLDDLWKIYCDPENVRFIPPAQCPSGKAELWAKYNRIRKAFARYNGIYAVELKDRSGVIGEAGFFNSSDDGDQIELGYILNSKYWNRGLGSELCRAMINFAFRLMGCKGVVARMYADNTASVRLAEKCGMNQTSDECIDSQRVFEFEIRNGEHHLQTKS